MKDLTNKVAVVTGAASGIGLAVTERLVREGMSVVMADIEAPRLEAASARLIEAGAPVSPFVVDVADASQIDALKDHTLATFGGVHLLMNNAGVANGRQNYKSSPAEWDWVMGVNVLGVAYGVSAFVPIMVEQGEGHVVNTASEAGLCSTAMLGPYHASKYAVVGLSETLSLELEGTGVGVSCLCPELVATRIFESTRNAPASLGYPTPGEIPVEQLEGFMKTVAMDPADVAADVTYAVRANRFWILTHQVTLARVHQRNDNLEAGRNPRNPVSSKGV